MEPKKLSKAIKSKNSFSVLVELVGGPDFSFGPIDKFLKAYKASDFKMPQGYEFVGITSPQSPGGVAGLAPSDVLAHIKDAGLQGDLDFVPHVTCKDHNVEAITSLLRGHRAAGVESLLALTGDKPVKAKGVFEVESVGLLNLVREINWAQITKASDQTINSVHQFFPGAAVSPFKYTEASLMMQYYKMEKKIAAGARYLITQLGYDWKKSVELFTYLKKNNIDIPVIGNVYLLSTISPAPRLMHTGKLPGCFVSKALYEKIGSESVDDHVERAAQQVAMYKALGAAGVDIGGVSDFAMLTKILTRAAEIGANWEQYKNNLCWPAEKAFYLYDEQGNQRPLSTPQKTFGQKMFERTHNAVMEPGRAGYNALKGLATSAGLDKGKGKLYKAFNAAEKGVKYLAFDCRECGDCYLPENFGICTLGGCEKGLDNAPCGDATADGKCGNNLQRTCVGERIYDAAAASKDGHQKLKKINKPRNPGLKYSSSIVNNLFHRDHTQKHALINIAEAIHGSIPKCGAIMKQLHAMGPDAFTKESGPLNYIRALIEMQVHEGADYVCINLDAFGEENFQIAADLMVQYVRLVRKWGSGLPVCIDSSNDDVLVAGLKEWYNTPEKPAQPLINSIKVHTIDQMMPLKKQYDFSFIGLLVTEEKAAGLSGFHSVDELYAIAQKIFRAAMQHGFKRHEIFFDSTVFPLSIDMPMDPDVPSYTYRAFESIKKIKNDPEMRGVNFSLGVSNSVRDLPGRRVGVCRAYVAKAMEYGLNAGIVNTSHHYGFTEADPKLMELVAAYAEMDGSAEKLTRAMDLMGEFCQENRKSPG